MWWRRYKHLAPGDLMHVDIKKALLKMLPRVANVSLAALIADIGPLLERCDNPEQVAAMCGACTGDQSLGRVPHRF